jgi:hypothetical protein
MDSVTRFYPRKISLLQVLVPGLKFEYGFESLRYSIRQVVKIGFSDLSKTENSPLCLRFLVKLYVFFLLRIVFTRKDKKKIPWRLPRSHKASRGLIDTAEAEHLNRNQIPTSNKAATIMHVIKHTFRSYRICFTPCKSFIIRPK